MSGDVSRETECFKSDAVVAQLDAKARGDRKNVFHGGTLCSGCYNEPPMAGQRYGKKCHAAAALRSYHRKQARLKALKTLEEQLKLSKGKDDGQDAGS